MGRGAFLMDKRSLGLLALLFFALLTAYGQDTTKTAMPNSADSLLTSLFDSSDTAQPLLPDRIMFTQRVFWGPNGLLRLVKLAPLTAIGRKKELKLRRAMLVGHQVLGFVTLAGFVAQGILGSQLYKAQGADYVRLRKAHETVATLTNITYGTTALLTLTAPPPLIGKRQRGFSSIKLHRALAIVHISGMVATNILARQIERNYELKPYHRAAAYTTFAAFGAAILAIKF